MEQPLVARRFQELHGCAASDIHSNGDRWIARGCGVEAHYVCVDKYADKHSFVWGGDTCVEEHSEPTIKPSDSSDESDAAPVEREGKLQIAVPLERSWLIAVAEPKAHPERTTFAYRAPMEGETEDCAVQLLVDGSPFAKPTRRRIAGELSEQSFRASKAELRDMIRAQRISVDVCGKIQTLSPQQRARFQQFAARFFELSPRPRAAESKPKAKVVPGADDTAAVEATETNGS
jgi:hypothetical protein